MPLNQTFRGRVYPATAPYEVGLEKIREFADALGDKNPVSRDVEAAKAHGHPEVVAPPTFAIVLTMRAEGQVVFDPTLGLDIGRVLHRDQKFRYSRSIRAHDVLTVTVSVDGIDEVGGNDVLTLSSEVRTVEGEHVCTATSTLVSRAAGREPHDD